MQKKAAPFGPKPELMNQAVVDVARALAISYVCY